MKSSQKVRVSSTPRACAVFGLPALLMPHESSLEMRAEAILGMRTNQILRAVKECSSSIYRAATAEAGVPQHGSMSKIDSNGALIEEICGPDTVRRLILEEHAKAAYAGRNPERIPVLEYALLKRWNAKFAGLQSGTFAKSTVVERVSAPGATEPPSSWPVTANGRVAHNLQNARPRHPFFSTPFDSYLINLDQNAPWMADASFVPHWVAEAGSLVLLQLASWDTLLVEDQAKLAGAAFAVASCLGSKRVLIYFMEVRPEIACYLQGLEGLTVNGEPLDGKPWERMLISEAQGRLTLAMHVMHHLDFELSSNLHLDSIPMMKDVIGECERIIAEASKHDLELSQDALAGLIGSLHSFSVQISSAGLNASFPGVNQVLKNWVGVLSDPRMNDTGKQQIALFRSMRKEIDAIEVTAEALGLRFARIQERHRSILDGGLPLMEQIQQMAQLSEDLADFERECREMDQQYSGREKPRIDDLAISEQKPETSEIERLKAEIEAQIDRMKSLQEELDSANAHMSDLDRENDRLRRENADLRMRTESLQLALGGGAGNAAEAQAGAVSAPVFEAVDDLILRQTPGSILRFLEAAYPDRLRVFDSVYESIDRQTSMALSQLYQKLKALCGPGLDAVRKTGRLIDMQDVVPGEIAVQESESVRVNRKLRNLRKFRDGRETREVLTHLNIDYATRMYFDYESAEDRILICYIGKHLASGKHPTI